MDGILLVDKPSGWTSHDVVAKVRRLTGVKRIGHTGTLDPLATGVLVLCLGQATRVVEYVAGHDKRYRATLRLGIETDTYDAQGSVTQQRPVGVSETALREALAAFVGDIQQVPPMYSALKRGGHKLVDLARRGVEVRLDPRQVHFYAIDLLRFESPDATVEVHCSSGTYVRSLAHDLGQKLGCGAHVAALTRTAVGGFKLAQAVPIEDFETACAHGDWPSYLLPLDAALSDFPPLTLDETGAARARHGMRINLPPSPATVEADRVRVYDPAGHIVGVMRIDRERGELRPDKIFAAHLSPTGESAAD